jgi:ABC-type Fe3+-hydroxamate transport system substrate-binding protein
MGALAMGRVAALLALLLVLGGTACGERSEPTGADAGLYPVTVTTERPIVVDRPARRIVVLDPAADSILDGLDVACHVVLNQTEGAFDVRAVRRARPDLIVASPQASERDLSRAASATGARVYTAPSDSLRQVERAITQLGLLTGAPVAARRLVRRIETRRHEVAARLERVADVSVFVDTGYLNTVPDQSLIGDVLREAHGTNVFGNTSEAGPVDVPDLLRLDPQVYLATSDSEATLKDLRTGRTRKLRAVRDGRFVVADAALLQPGPRIGDGLMQVARLLHPDAFR